MTIKLKLKRPIIREGWKRVECAVKDTEAWFHPRKQILVLSAVDPSGKDDALEYHVSATATGNTSPTHLEMQFVRESFGMNRAEEYNLLGTARHLWLLVESNETVH